MNKEWKIKFSREVDKYSLYSNIKVVDKFNRNVAIKIEVDKKDKKIVYVKPVKSYVQGKDYKLIISPKIKGKDGKELKEGKIIKFKVRNLYAGLPYEDGILVIGNTAYSMDYLVKNSQIKNDILRGEHSIFYVYEQATDKVKDILGDKFIDGNTKPVEYDINKPMEYIDADGNKTLYAWNKDKALFEIAYPSIDVKISVNLNSNADKVLVMNVEKANWIDGACYYKVDNSNLYYKIGEPIIYTSTDAREGIKIFSSSMTKLGEGTINSYFEGKYNIKIKLYPKKGEGNSAGNIVNNGYVTADENGYIFYNNTGDSNRLYKYDTNGIFHSVISDDFAQYINVADEWVYYSNYSDKAKLYRIKSDGSSNQKLNDEYSAFLTIVGDYIYYSNYSDNGRITRIKKDGSDVTTDNKGEKHGIPISTQVKDEAFFLNYVGEWIYYSNINDHYKVYSVNTNGTYRKKLSDEGASSIQVVDDWVYYTNNKGELRKVKTDGSKETQDLKSVVSKFDRGYFFNVVDDWIYYSNDKDSSRLYKIKTDGTENTRLTLEPVTYINIAYNTIYFVSKGKMYTVPIDTNGRIRPIAVQKVESDKKVVQVDDVKVIVPYDEVNDTIETLEARYLPPKVSGIMSDNRLQRFVVQWDKKNVGIRDGVRTYKGKLIGYNQYIELTMRIPSEMLNETTTIAIFNNAGARNGYIEVYSNPVQGDEANIPPKLREGDELKIYADKDLTKLLRTTTVSRQGIHNKGIFQSVELDRYGTKKYYLTIKRQGKAESKGTEFTVGEAPGITNHNRLPVRDIDDVGLGIDGRDFNIQEMKTTKNKTVEWSRIYLAIKGRQLNLQSDNLVPFDSNVVSDGAWIGRRYQDSSLDDKVNYPDKERMNQDSFGNLLMGTNYDLFLVSKYSDAASPDNRGKSPNIIGWASSEPASITVKSEGLPYDPGLNTETKRYGETITLQITPKPGETAYLIPVWESKFDDPEYDNYIKNTWLNQVRTKNPATGEVTTTWLEEAKVWLKENGQWPFSETGKYKEAVENGYVTKLEGDGSSRNIQVPTGFKYQPYSDGKTEDERIEMANSKYYAPNIKYKLVIINEIGVSSVSNGTLTVDNQPPVVARSVIEENNIENDIMYIKCGEPIQFQSRYESSDIYIYNKSSHNLDNVQMLEDAVAVGEAYKFSVLSGVTTPLPTDELKPYYDKNSPNAYRAKYKVWVADEVGNVKQIEPVMVYVELDKLKQVQEDLKRGIAENRVLEIERDAVEKKRKDIETMIKIIEDPNGKDVITQRSIDIMVDQAIELMMQMGIPHVNEDKHLGIYDQTLMVRKFLDKLRLYGSKNSAANLEGLRERIWLPTEYGYQKIPGAPYDYANGDYKINIVWSIYINGEEKATNLIDIRDPNNMGVVNRPDGQDQRLKLKATCTNAETGGEMTTIEYDITIKARKFLTLVTTPSSDKATIVLEGVQVNSENDIIVQPIVHEGLTYTFTVTPNTNLVDWNIIVNQPVGTVTNPAEIPIKITIDGITLDNQVKLKIPIGVAKPTIIYNSDSN